MVIYTTTQYLFFVFSVAAWLGGGGGRDLLTAVYTIEHHNFSSNPLRPPAASRSSRLSRSRFSRTSASLRSTWS